MSRLGAIVFFLPALDRGAKIRQIFLRIPEKVGTAAYGCEELAVVVDSVNEVPTADLKVVTTSPKSAGSANGGPRIGTALPDILNIEMYEQIFVLRSELRIRSRNEFEGHDPTAEHRV